MIVFSLYETLAIVFLWSMVCFVAGFVVSMLVEWWQLVVLVLKWPRKGLKRAYKTKTKKRNTTHALWMLWRSIDRFWSMSKRQENRAIFEHLPTMFFRIGLSGKNPNDRQARLAHAARHRRLGHSGQQPGWILNNFGMDVAIHISIHMLYITYIIYK